VTTDICGKKDSHAVRLDGEAVETIGKARLHRKVATTIFFESNGGMLRAEATIPEIRLAVAEPDIDVGNVETVLEALTEACYYLTVERNRYHFSFRENLNKRYADRRANIKNEAIDECVRSEIQKVFAASSGIERIFYPERSNQVPDRPVLTFAVLSPEQSVEDEKRSKALVESLIRECGTSARTFKSALVFCAAQSAGPLREDARRLLAWREIEDELPGISVDETQRHQLTESIKKSQRDLRENVWRSYKNILLLGKDNQLRVIDLGLVHSSAAESLVQFIINHLRQADEIQSGISPNFLVRNWPPAFKEWSTRAVRDAFYASPLFPRLLNPETIKDTIARGVSNAQLGYVGRLPGDRYRPFNFERSLDASDVEISDEMFIVTAETAAAYRGQQAKGSTAEETSSSPGGTTVGVAGVPDDPGSAVPGLFPEGASGGRETGGVKPGTSAMSWRGEVPAQKWMNFYTRVLTKLGVGERLKLTVSVEYKFEGTANKQKVDDVKSALRELGLDDRLDEF
jgi:hypothetical protein